MKHSLLLILFCCFFFNSPLKAQELIVKTNGDSIRAKLLEVGISTISYKKSNMIDGPTFTVDRSEISFIMYKNGEIEYINKTNSVTTLTTAATSSSNAAAQQTPSQTKNKIEFKEDKYYINGQKVKRKEVDRYLSRSKNPAIALGFKGAKAMGTAQKIVKITSYPTTIVGSVTSLVTWAEGYQLVQRGRATRHTFVVMGLNLLGTISLPITNKILKKKSDKMYDKLIDMYNVTN
jgi:hypothetical protein